MIKIWDITGYFRKKLTSEQHVPDNLLFHLEEYIKSWQFTGKEKIKLLATVPAGNLYWHNELKSDSQGSFHCVTPMLGQVFFSVVLFSKSLSQILAKTKNQIKTTPLPENYLNCWAILHSHTWRQGGSKQKRSRNMCLAALENFPKWQTAVKVRLREAQYKPDKFSISTEHQMAGAVPHHPWSKSSLL